MSILKRVGAVLGVAAVVTTMTLPQFSIAAAPQRSTAAASINAEEFQERINNLQATIDEEYASLTDEQQTKIYTKRYKAVSGALATLEKELMAGQKTVNLMWGANLQEKRAMKAILNSMVVETRVYQKAVEDINDQYEDDGDEDVANAALTDQVEGYVVWLKANKDLFVEYVSKFFTLKIKAAIFYTDIGITFAMYAAEDYASLGEDTAKITELLTAARTYYDTAEAQYMDGQTTEEGETDDQEQLFNAMVNILKARSNLSRAQVKLVNIEESYQADEASEGSQQ